MRREFLTIILAGLGLIALAAVLAGCGSTPAIPATVNVAVATPCDAPVPDKPVGSRRESTLHLWVVPARVDGDWLLQVGDAAPLRMTLEQRYQRFTIEVPDARPLLRPVGPAAGASAAPHPGAGPAARGHGSLAGAAIGVELPADRRDLRFKGTAEGDRMQGLVMDGGARRPWSARRVRDAAARPARPR